MIRNKEREHFKIFEGAFDQRTLNILYDLSNKQYFRTLDGVISTGKEADVYRATTKDKKTIAIKIYRVETSGFVKTMHTYIDGDPRFEDYKHTKRGVIKVWCQKEFRNLSDAYNAKLSVPKPIKAVENVLLMGFIGENGKPAPTLHEVQGVDVKKAVKFMKKFVNDLLVKCEMVHADLSEFNVLVTRKKFYVIDMGQAVSKKHPRAQQFLQRDLENIDNFERKTKK